MSGIPNPIGGNEVNRWTTDPEPGGPSRIGSSIPSSYLSSGLGTHMDVLFFPSKALEESFDIVVSSVSLAGVEVKFSMIEMC
eukprot:8991123-Ditylum_brightwellii.AAC.1